MSFFGRDIDGDDIEPLTLPDVTSSRNWFSQTSRSCMISVRRLGVRRILTVVIFFLINFFNYVDRFVCASLLEELEDVFNIGDSESGLLQTCFFASYMMAAPVFGYFGDRTSRVRLMTIGLVLWAVISGCAAVVPSNLFGVFLLLRALIGIGEASYATLCPTVIADIFVGPSRTMVLLLYSVAVPLGCGASYIISPAVAATFGSWRFAFLVVPIAVTILAILLAMIVQEPIRGQADGLSNLKSTSFYKDILYLMHVKSFIYVTLGFVSLSFCLGAISYWCPLFFDRAYRYAGSGTSELSINTLTYIFGAVTVGAGIGGVFIGTTAAYALRRMFGDSVDAAICGWGMILGAPCMFFVFITIVSMPILAWVLVAITVTLLSLNWVLVIDITMYSVVPTRRAAAAACQMFLGHALGDAISPWIVGGLSSAFAPKDHEEVFAAYIGLQSALYIMPFILTIGALAFMFCSLHCTEDHHHAQEGDLGEGTGANEEGPVTDIPDSIQFAASS